MKPNSSFMWGRVCRSRNQSRSQLRQKGVKSGVAGPKIAKESTPSDSGSGNPLTSIS